MIWVTAVVNFALFVIGNRDPVVALLVHEHFLGVADVKLKNTTTAT